MDRIADPSGNGRLLEDPEVPEKATRRQYTADYKLKVLRELDGCKQPGDIGAVLRREGLYSSVITNWRRQRERGELDGLGRKSRDRKEAALRERKDREIRQLRRENARLERRLKQAHTVIEVQKKISEMLNIPLSNPESESDV